ncbi:pre-mRNA-splicing factor SLU7-A-like isoform X1 [Magnolia sinica]|uniref:pre-mRNA-splicing factor SLU7-A-like isoform X1 n=1 Tax=Magnolia sinica TaxID=86752 RepID=UPI002658B104|nr:pre-mRNA-splicing factor SLU7-A-like isoform X1 [Magnolia sinica]
MVEGSSMGLQMLQANYPEQLLVLGLGDASVVEKPATVEEKRLATWGTDVPEDLVLDQKLLVEALKKVIFAICLTCDDAMYKMWICSQEHIRVSLALSVFFFF